MLRRGIAFASLCLWTCLAHLVVIGRDRVIRGVFRGDNEKKGEAIVTEMVEAINEP